MGALSVAADESAAFVGSLADRDASTEEAYALLMDRRRLLVDKTPTYALDRAHLERAVSLVRQGAVRVLEITLYPLSQAAAAHEVSEGRHLRGKLVFNVRQS